MHERHTARGMVSATVNTSGEFPWRKKKQIIDVFGPWSPVDELAAGDLKTRRLPDPIVRIQSVLEANFDLTEQQTLPYHVFDTLRNRHSIDLTGFNASMTRHGNLYRSYVLMRGT